MECFWSKLGWRSPYNLQRRGYYYMTPLAKVSITAGLVTVELESLLPGSKTESIWKNIRLSISDYSTDSKHNMLKQCEYWVSKPGQEQREEKRREAYVIVFLLKYFGTVQLSNEAEAPTQKLTPRKEPVALLSVLTTFVRYWSLPRHQNTTQPLVYKSRISFIHPSLLNTFISSSSNPHILLLVCLIIVPIDV